MKKLFTTTLLILSFTMAYSQLVVRPSAKFGFNFASIDEDLEGFNTDGRSGYDIGIDLRMEQGHVFFHPGLHFQKTRLDLTSLTSSNPEAIRTQVSSLKFPLNAGVYITSEASLLHVHFRGGIVPQFVTGAGEVEELGFDKDLLNNFLWGANAAIGIDFILLTVEFSYEFGLTSFYNDYSPKNNMATLSFGFIF